MPLKVLVTGAAGGLGREVCKALLAGGHQVVAMDRVYRKDLPFKVELAELLDELAVYRLADGCQAVVHLANYPGLRHGSTSQMVYRENVATDINVFQAAVEVGVKRLIFASSVQVISGGRWHGNREGPSCLAYLPIDGQAPTCPRNLYALSKETGESQLRYYAAVEKDLSCVAVRYPLLVRRGQPDWVRHRHRDAEDWGNPDEGFAYLNIEDAGSFTAAVVERQIPGYDQVFPAAPDNTTGKLPAELVPKHYPDVPLKVPLEKLTSLVDTSAIVERYGWSPRTINLFARS
jgi:nucleoside-diphosphate-sugar epimerase